MIQAFGIRSVLRIWSKPARDRKYLDFLKTLPCLACGKNWGVDPAHTGPHAMSQKASDYDAIPLCRDCHREYDKAPHDFSAVRGWDLPELRAFFQHTYELKTGRKVEQTEERRAA